MQISLFTDRIKVLVLALGLALLSGAGAPAAFADAAAVSATAAALAKAKGMGEAPAAITAAGVNCDLADALALNATTVTKDGKPINGETYEVACKTGPGWFLTQLVDGTSYLPMTCTHIATLKRTVQPTVKTCTLPGNSPDYTWLNAVVKPFASNCDVNNARFVGSGTLPANNFDRYEFGCASGPGGMVDVAQPGSTFPTDFRTCLIPDSKGAWTCQYTTKDVETAAFKSLAAQGSATCTVSDMRFVAETGEADGYYYEFGCSNQPGFIIRTKLDNSFVRTIPCASAAALGGCTLTSAGVAAADQNSIYTGQLTAAGEKCTVAKYNVVGSDDRTKRDFVEFKCPEQPFGLIGYMPQAGSAADVDVHDCFIDQIRSHHYCSMVTTDQLKAQLDKLIKVAKPDKGCDVSDVRYIAETDKGDGSIFVEIACGNKRGYIAAVKPDRQSLDYADPCTTAAKNSDEDLRCKIPGNGTYADSH